MAKATTVREALAKWEEKSGEKVSEAKAIKLYGQVPPIEKMDASLSTLTNCEYEVFSSRATNLDQLSLNKILESSVVELPNAPKWQAKFPVRLCTVPNKLGSHILEFRIRQLSLSTNCIDKITNLNGLKNLRILSLGRNNIKILSGLEAVGDTLEELWISYNLIERLKGIKYLKNLRVLYMSNNLVKEWGEFMRLADLPCLADLVFVGNPLEEKHSTEGTWMDEASNRLPNLKKLDGTPVIKQEEDEGDGEN